MPHNPIRIGADIGGTFTDIVLEQGDRQISTKLLTTLDAPEQAILQGIKTVCTRANVALNEITQIIHGTTLATNALIERRGAHTAFITTKGFRDVIEMRTESRFEQYDLNLVLPEPLLPRHQRFTVSERLSAGNETLIPLDENDLQKTIKTIKKQGFESIAVGLLHSYQDGRHERIVRDALAREMPDALVSLSCEVSPQMREYERFNTVIANAYIKPLIKSYLHRLTDSLSQMGVSAPVFLIHSGGGLISLETAADFPVRLVESGPAGGAVFAADIASRFGLNRVLSFDMGGTTAKICLIKDQTPKNARVFEVARSYRFKKGSGMPISIPVIDMVEIGAGGGSLASVDTLGQIRVGPQSAGSLPGPACYGRGGDCPTVTDADLVLGRLDAAMFAGGEIPLNTEAAKTALTRVIGADLSMSASESAFGLSEVVDENMANAARVHAVENGEELGDYTMIAFGGAAPLHAGRLMQKLGIKRLIVPSGAGVGSAIGFLRAPASFEATSGLYMRLSAFDAGAIKAALAELRATAGAFVRGCAPNADIGYHYKCYMRYIGQGWEIPVAFDAKLADMPDAERLEMLFTEAYKNLFARKIDGLDIEIVQWSLNAMTAPNAGAVRAVLPMAAGDGVVSGETRLLFDAIAGGYAEAMVIARADIATGEIVRGAAIIFETDTTIILPKGAVAMMQPDGSLDIQFLTIND